VRVAVVEQHSFISDQLHDGTVVLDLGMNRGEFARLVSARYKARVLGVEPVADFANSLRQAGLEVLEAAVAGETGKISLHVHPTHGGTVVERLGGMERVALEVDAVTLDDVFRHYDLDVVDLVKMDIEGAELDVLERVGVGTLERIKQISVEFHAFLNPEQRPRVEMITARLERLGFAQLDFSNDAFTDVLFVNRSRIPLSRVQRYALLLRYKYVRGALRASLRYAPARLRQASRRQRPY
jgi:FkbM family methyltransferase